MSKHRIQIKLSPQFGRWQFYIDDAYCGSAGTRSQAAQAAREHLAMRRENLRQEAIAAMIDEDQT